MKKAQKKPQESGGPVARALVTAGMAVSLLITLGIVFVVFGANRQNAVVGAVVSASQSLVGVIVHALSPSDPNLRVVVDWGLIACAYLILGRLLARLINR